MLALKFEKNTKDEDRAVVLQKMILRGNKLLIILDDMWSNIPLSSIGIPNTEELQRCNSKVLITSRLQKVCQEMQCDAIINLRILSEEDSLKLFLKKTRLASHELTGIYSVAREVAKKCAGIPVALVAVARALRDENLDEWKKAAERLQASQLADPEDENHVFNNIKFSYEYLKSTEAKSCLLLCCLFPEDYDIPIEDLFRYGFGKGLFQEFNTLQEARATAYQVVESLKSSSLLLDSEKKGCVKMHDVIRDVVMSISSSKEGQPIFVKSGRYRTEWPRIDANINYSAISVVDTKIRKIPKDVVCPKLVQILSLKSSDITEFPETFFQSHNELRVLDLRDVKDIQKIVKAFDLLTNLRALFLYNGGYWYWINNWDLSMIAKLGKLEILSIRDNFFFPNDLGELSKLRMLDVSYARHESFPSGVISRLINLEELYMKANSIWGCGDLYCKEFIGLPKLNILEVQIHDVGCLPKVVNCNPNWVKFDIIISKYNYYDHLQYLAKLPQHERSLCLDTTINNLPYWFQKVVTERAERQVYIFFHDMTNILAEYSTGRLHGVKYLSIIEGLMARSQWRNFLEAETGDDPKKPVFENLEELNVESVPCIWFCESKMPPGSFCNLKKLTLRTCRRMSFKLLSSDLLRRLQNLEELLCVDLKEISYVFETEGMEPEEIICPKLRKIHLHYLLRLSIICLDHALPHAMFQNLKSLKVGYCPHLRYVFPRISVAKCFLQLEELYVYNCPNLVAVIGHDKEADNDGMIEFPELKILFLLNLYNLVTFGGSSVSSPRPIINFPKLEQACFIGCFSLSGFKARALSAFRSLNTEVFKHFSDGKEFYNVDYNSTAQRLHEESLGMYGISLKKKDEKMLEMKKDYTRYFISNILSSQRDIQFSESE